MRISPEEFKQINLKIDLIELIQFHGIEYRKETSDRYKIRCPFHEKDNEPSLTIYTHTRPHSWYCFGCGKGVDPFQFFRLINRKSFQQALELFADPNKVFTIEDHVRVILESGKKYIHRNRLEAAIESCMIDFSIKTRSIIRKNINNLEKISEIYRILMDVDDFIESDLWVDYSEFDVKAFFRQQEKSLRKC